MYAAMPLVAQEESSESLIALIAALPIWLSVFIFAMLAIPVLCQMVLYARAGQPFWAALIPIYSQWVYARILGRNPLMVVVLPFALFIIASFINYSVGFFLNPFFPFEWFLFRSLQGVLLIYALILIWDLYIVFGAPTALGIIGILFPTIGQLLLVLLGYEYQGPSAGLNRRALTGLPWMDYSVIRADNPGMYGGKGITNAEYMANYGTAHAKYKPDHGDHARGAFIGDWTPVPAVGPEDLPPAGAATMPAAADATPAPSPGEKPPVPGQVPPLAPDPAGPPPSNTEIGLPPFDPSA